MFGFLHERRTKRSVRRQKRCEGTDEKRRGTERYALEKLDALLLAPLRSEDAEGARETLDQVFSASSALTDIDHAEVIAEVRNVPERRWGAGAIVLRIYFSRSKVRIPVACDRKTQDQGQTLGTLHDNNIKK